MIVHVKKQSIGDVYHILWIHVGEGLSAVPLDIGSTIWGKNEFISVGTFCNCHRVGVRFSISFQYHGVAYVLHREMTYDRPTLQLVFA